MAQHRISTRVRTAPEARNGRRDGRYDRRLNEILEYATDVFYERGYEGASMRDLSRYSGMSLAGLYYYFESKEKLLYLIQKHTFATITQRLRQRLQGVSDPEERIRIFIHNHLEYFLANQKAMKVLSHEEEALRNHWGAEIRAMKREYFRAAVALLEALKRARKLEFSTRIAALSLFGMVNWIYTWHNPRVDGDADQLARRMAHLFLHGVRSRVSGAQPRKSVKSVTRGRRAAASNA